MRSIYLVSMLSGFLSLQFGIRVRADDWSFPPGPIPPTAESSVGIDARYSPSNPPPPSSVTLITPPVVSLRAPVFDSELATLGACFDGRANSNVASLNRPQVEPSVVSSPLNSLQLVAAFADYINDAAPGVALSINGGHSWSAPAGGAIVPNPPGFLWGNRTLATHLAGGDAALAWGLGDTLYFSTLGFQDSANPPNGDCSRGGLYVYRSDNAGQTWTLPANAPVVPNTTTIFRDKEYIAADSNPASPFAGNVYMAWDDDVYSACPHAFPGNFVVRELRFSVSIDGAASSSAPILLASGCFIAPVPAVAANGDVYVVWYDCNAGNRQLVRKSINGGASFGSTKVAATGFASPPSPLVGSAFRVNAPFPSIATDPANANNVYVTWPANNGASQVDVFVSSSINGGNNWSLPVRVNDDVLGNPRDQFFPWISVGGDGTVRVMWGDDRLDLVNAGGRNYDIFMAESTNQGASFGSNVRVTSVSSNPNFDGFGGTFIGDYFGLSVSGVAVWDDCRTSAQSQDIFAGSCVAPPPPSPMPDPSAIDKTRFISFSVPAAATAAAENTALRVKLTSLHHVLPPYTNGASIAFAAFEGQSQYVGPPVQYVESESSLTPFKASQLQCTPHYRDWSTITLLHVTGEAIVPSSSYDVENVAFACQNQETTPPCVTGGANVSTALTIKTGRWGDAVITFQDPNLAASQPDFDDIGALVDKFKSLLGAPIKARSKLSGVDARGLIDITPDVGFDDISLDVDAFKGVPYPYKPGMCTGAPATACQDNTECAGTGPCILCP